MSFEVRQRDWGGYAASGLLGGVAAGPWLYGYSYSRGYDLFLWIYNAWYLKGHLVAGGWPNWSVYGACGQPFFKIAGLADGAILAALMGIGGVFAGVQFLVLLFYVVAAVGMYVLARSFLDSRFVAWIAAAAYVLSWFMTFTVYFQVYLGNVLVYAVLPWFILCVRTGLVQDRMRVVLAAGGILALAVLANPQVAIKMLVLAAWLALLQWGKVPGRRWVAVWGCIAGVALALALFDVASAVRLRGEVVTMSARPNSYISPFTLVAIPAFALGLALEWVAGWRWPEVQLWELLYSEYPGLVVVALALLALVYARDRAAVRWLGLGVGAVYAFFFLAMPHLLATSWLGTSHNMLIAVVLGLALLAGYGADALRLAVAARWGTARSHYAMVAVAGLLCVESYSLLLGLKIWGATSTHPKGLPEVAVWDKVAEAMRDETVEPRFYSYNQDWTIGLFPVLTGLPTANVLELRQRSPDYQAYLDLVRKCGRSLDCGPAPSVLLAPLNVAFADVPRKYFTYVGPNSGQADYDGYIVGLAGFDRDGHLRRFAERKLAAEDVGYQASTTAWSPMAGQLEQSNREELAQVVYRNGYRLPAFVAPRTVAIVGGISARQEVFARIVTLPDYDPGRILYLLVDSLAELEPPQRAALAGFLAADGEPIGHSVPLVDLAQLRAWYGMAAEKGLPTVEKWQRNGAETLVIRLDKPVRENRFLFVSQQRFRDWQGHYGDGASAPLYRATAGLSAVYLKAGKKEVRLQYELPSIERWSRCFSLLATVFFGGAAFWGCAWLRKWFRKIATKAIQ